MRILAIETSCDETSIAIVDASGGLQNPRFRVLHNFVSSQIKVHRPYGGVVPMLAKREHAKNLPKILKKIPQKKLKAVDLITVTVGPGLEPTLWEGINFAKTLAQEIKKPLIGANHLEGHLYSFLLRSQKNSEITNNKLQSTKLFPAIVLLVSGGHTILLLLKSLTSRKKLGETRDDAAGEAFDKVAKLIGLSYPGGPEIEKLAKIGSPHAIRFPRPMINAKNFDFSFSGLKTAVYYFWHDLNNQEKEQKRADVAAGVQEAITDVLREKTKNAIEQFHARAIILCGGVAANKYLRQRLETLAKTNGLEFFAPQFEFNTDNAAMIAAAAYINYLLKKKRKLAAQGNLSL